jgi:hypothetical protein
MTPREHLREEHGHVMKVLSHFQKIIMGKKRPREEWTSDLKSILDFSMTDQPHLCKQNIQQI